MTVISVQGSPARLTMMARHLQQCHAEIYSFVRLFYIVTGWRQGIDRVCKLIASRGSIQLLRRFSGESRHQRRVNVKGSSLLKRRNLRCGDGRLYSQRPRPFWQAMAGCIAVGSFNAAAEPLVRFYSTAQTNGRAVTLRD